MAARERAEPKTDVAADDVAAAGLVTQPLLVGTDCSGLESPLQALDNLKVRYRHVFSCESDAHLKKFISYNFKPEKYYDDITTRDNSKTPYVDLYVAGFPCQPFSVAGHQHGFQDPKGRGTIVGHCIDYIKKQTPKMFILENVKGFTTLKDGACHRAVIRHN